MEGETQSSEQHTAFVAGSDLSIVIFTYIDK